MQMNQQLLNCRYIYNKNITNVMINSMKMIANPASDMISIGFPLLSDMFYGLNIYDMIGNKILRTNISDSNRNIDISSVMNGVYIIQLEA